MTKPLLKSLVSFLLFTFLFIHAVRAQDKNPQLNYTVEMSNAEAHVYDMKMEIKNFQKDTLTLKIPNWSPGYYQYMNFFKNISDVKATSGNPVIEQVDSVTWKVYPVSKGKVEIVYKVKTERKFVGNSYLDTTHAYILPANNFFYPEGHLTSPMRIKIVKNPGWTGIATGLNKGTNKDELIAPDFDILYDSPILVGNLEELPSFQVKGITHYFEGVELGDFDKADFSNRLKKVVEAGVELIGDIPYEHYTFIGIGPGRGGIEHLNSTAVSFNGSDLKSPEDYDRVLNFLAHEYFHHFNVKRIRPFELGPFDYVKGNRSNQLWISEGLTVYYEYVISKMAGLKDDKDFTEEFEHHINTLENNPGRLHQSLVESSYYTWSDGPFGTMNKEKGKTISYYNKGPVVGLLLDFAIRNASSNKYSLDDVMRKLYWTYYKKLQRGFTEAEFQVVCEEFAGEALNEIFEYVYTTKELDYKKYLGYAGLELQVTDLDDKKDCKIVQLPNPDALQKAILNSWLKNSNP